MWACPALTAAIGLTDNSDTARLRWAVRWLCALGDAEEGIKLSTRPIALSPLQSVSSTFLLFRQLSGTQRIVDGSSLCINLNVCCTACAFCAAPPLMPCGLCASFYNCA